MCRAVPTTQKVTGVRGVSLVTMATRLSEHPMTADLVHVLSLPHPISELHIVNLHLQTLLYMKTLLLLLAM